jgi:hypothetical protein
MVCRGAGGCVTSGAHQRRSRAPHPAAGVGGHDHASGVHGDAVDGVPRTRARGRPRRRWPGRSSTGAGCSAHSVGWSTSPAGRAGRCCGRTLPDCSLSLCTGSGVLAPAAAADADHGHIGHPPNHGVAVAAFAPTARTVPAAVVEQVAEHHRDIAVDRGVSDRHTEFNSAHDRVGDNGSSTRRRVRHRAGNQRGAGRPASWHRLGPFHVPSNPSSVVRDYPARARATRSMGLPPASKLWPRCGHIRDRSARVPGPMPPTVRPESTPCRLRFTLSQTPTISAKRAEVHQNLSRRPSPRGTATRR